MPYILDLDAYKGPIEKLLELISDRKLEITRISLSQVTADFVGFVEKLEREEKNLESRIAPEEKTGLKELIADFLVVASQLILLKSKELIPDLELSEEEESDLLDLEIRLKIHEELKGAKNVILAVWTSLPKMLSREFLMNRPSVFMPPSAVSPETLLQTVKKISGELEKITTPATTFKKSVINLESKIEEIIKKITKKPESIHSFRAEKSRSELIVLFLAILHLIRAEIIHVEQPESFGSITIAKKNND